MMKFTVLGTACSMPTKERSLTSLAAQFAGETMLFDCSEGVQKRLMEAGIGLVKVSNIFITHWHGDHFFGLFGLLQTMSLLGKKTDLTVWTPKSKLAAHVKEVIGVEGLGYKAEFKVLKPGIVFERNGFTVEAVRLDHSIEDYGFIIAHDKGRKFNKQKALALGVPEGPLFSKLQKGESVKVGKKTVKASQVLEGPERVTKAAYFFDTAVMPKMAKKLENCDLLFHECTFLERDKDKAKETKHSTAAQLAKFCKKAKVKQLVALHFSARYKDPSYIEAELKQHFENSIVPRELESFEV